MISSLLKLAVLRARRADEIQAMEPGMTRLDALKQACKEIKANEK